MVFSSILLRPWFGCLLLKRRKISILEFFSRKAIIPAIRGASREDAIEQLVELAAEHENIEKVQQLKDAVLERERARGTAMEEGIAVPHARTDLVKKPLVVIGRSLSGIEWDSPDGKPVRFIFLTITPDGKDDWQVQILGLIATMMSDEETRRKMLDAADAGEIWKIVHEALRPMW